MDKDRSNKSMIGVVIALVVLLLLGWLVYGLVSNDEPAGQDTNVTEQVSPELDNNDINAPEQATPELDNDNQ